MSPPSPSSNKSVHKLQTCQKTIESCSSPTNAEKLLGAVNEALNVAPPKGSPSVITEQGRAYVAAGKECETVASDLKAVVTSQLPTAWKGKAAETASDAFKALAREIGTATTTLERAGRALTAWAEDLKAAQLKDHNGRALLESVQKNLDTFSLTNESFMDIRVILWYEMAYREASEGIRSMLSAAQDIEKPGSDTARLLNQLAEQARAEQVHGKGLDPLDAVVLANEKNPGGPADAGDILTENQLSRGSQLLDKMSSAERQKFETLLAQAKSPEEAAYIWKSMAAGHSISDVEKFAKLIHPYGSNPTWLAEHLTPTFNSPASAQEDSKNLNLTYKGQDIQINGYTLYSQGNVGDCVAASTVVAQASLDPNFMLKLTTGEHPGADGTDSPEAFQARLQHEYTSQYAKGQSVDGHHSNPYPAVDDGIWPKGTEFLAKSDLGRATGTSYHYVPLDGSSANQAALPRIEAAVDSGRPVPIDVYNSSAGHQMMIIGHDGNKLEIYNPWGFTSWVTEDQFVNNNLGSLTPGADLNAVSAVTLPS